MDGLPEDKFLKYNHDTLIYMRKLYNLDRPGEMDEAIDRLDDWVKKQGHFVKKDFSREYLERVILMLKGSVERSKTQLENICTLRTLLPQYFEKLNAKNDFKLLHKHHTSSLLPRLTEDHFRIYLLRFEPEKFYRSVILSIYYYTVLIAEYLKKHDVMDGLITIVDYRGIASMLEFVTHVDLSEMRKMATIILEGFDCRAKKFVFISTSQAIELMVKILKQILSEKLGQRIYVVSDLEGLHKYVPKALLPFDYGGEEKPLAVLRDEFQDVLASKENIKYLKEMSKARTNESLRVSSKINNDFLGLAGSFRTLNVD